MQTDRRRGATSQRSLTIIRVIFFGMASLVLLIGVGGILNVGLATVGERVEEFALRRAVGTPRLLLAGIVLSETLLTGLLTAAAAIGAAAFRCGWPGRSWPAGSRRWPTSVSRGRRRHPQTPDAGTAARAPRPPRASRQRRRTGGGSGPEAS